MKYYMIAGEASGDLHGSNLIKALQDIDSQTEISCWGGDKMEAAGAGLVKHYRDLAFMGFAEVVKNLPVILRNISFCKKDIASFKPDVLVLIDYPGFNMRIAKWAHLQKIKVVWYISPQLWAWKENRIKSIKRDVDKMMVILPFEKEFYRKHNFEVTYVGHPLAEVIHDFKKIYPKVQREKIVAILPGSRKQEILKKLPIMLKVADHFPDYKFVTAMAPGLPESFYSNILNSYKNVDVVADQTYALLLKAEAALVTSGTATLEAALFEVPQIICYKGSKISYEIARRLIKIKFIGLVNLIMDKAVVKELIQHELTVENLVEELKLLLSDTPHLTQIKKDYKDLDSLLTSGGNASANAAKIIYDFNKI
jgi:lipid-A-disaccharide synthase